MSRLITSARINVSTTITLTESELGALAFIASFGADVVIDKLSALSAGVKDNYRDGLWDFFHELHQHAGAIQDATERARAEFHNGKSKESRP